MNLFFLHSVLSYMFWLIKLFKYFLPQDPMLLFMPSVTSIFSILSMHALCFS